MTTTMAMTKQTKVRKTADLDVAYRMDNNALVIDTFLLNNETVDASATRVESTTEYQSQLLDSLCFIRIIQVRSGQILMSSKVYCYCLYIKPDNNNLIFFFSIYYFHFLNIH